MTYTASQRRIQNLGRRLSTPYSRRVRMALMMALGVEANFSSPDQAHSDRDSEGPLQQRPSQGWGPTSETDAQDIQQFLQRASALETRGFRGGAGQLAQAVQGSAYPERYGQRRAEAAALLGSGGASAAAASPGAILDQAAAGGNPRLEFAKSMISAVKRNDTRQALDALAALKDQQTSVPTGAGQGVGAPSAPRARHRGDGVEELIYDPVGSIFDGVRSNKPYGGHGDHEHVADDDPRVMLAIIKRAIAMGARVTENPYTTGQLVRSGHAKNSWHKREFAGLFNGRKLGMGADISADPDTLKALFRWVARNYG